MRGSIVRRALKGAGDGKQVSGYYIVYDLPAKYDAAKGHYVRNQKWESVPPPSTRRHAERLLAERLAQLHAGSYLEPSRAPLRDFADLWLEKYALGQVRPATMEQYHWLLDRHILPVLGDKPLCSINPEDAHGLRSAKMADGLSPQSVKHLLRLLRQMLGHAVLWGYLRANPCDSVKAPVVPRHEMDCLSPAEVRLFLAHVPASWYAFFLTAVTTGLRMGEMLAMKWDNLSWHTARYHVKEMWSRPRDGKEAGFAPPKTATSAQPVDLTPTCLEALRGHRQRQAQEKLEAGEKYTDLGLVFATRTGSPWDHRNVTRRYFESSLRAAGLRVIRFHDLRHTCASLLIAQGESPKYVQRQLRHASSQMTFDRYGHLFPDTHHEVTRRLDVTLFGDDAPARQVMAT